MSRQRAFANQEREAQAKRLNRLGRAGLLMLATVLSLMTAGLVAVDQLYRPDTFVVTELKIKGKFLHLKPEQVESVISNHGLGNFFSIELDQIKREIENLPWVQQADVRRQWPNALSVYVQEHRPVMRWQNDKWVTSAGKVIQLPGEINVPNSIVLFGHERDASLMLGQAVVWKRRLALNGLSLRKVELSGSHAWTLKLEHGDSESSFELLLGREQVEERLARFEFLFETQFSSTGRKLQRVDARYPDGLAIRASTVKTSNTDALANNALALSE